MTSYTSNGACVKQLPYGPIRHLTTTQYVRKVNRSIFSENLGLGRVNDRFEGCDDLFRFVCAEDSRTCYDDIAP